MEFKMQVEGERQISRRLTRVTGAVDDLSRPFDVIGKDWRGEIDKNFASRGSRFGRPWKKRAIPRPWPILEDSGDLRGSFVHAATRTQLVVGNADWKFAYHQGKSRPSTPVPRRIMLMITNNMASQAIRTISRYVVGHLK